MNLKESIVFSTVSLALLLGGQSSAMASMVDGDMHRKLEQIEHHNRRHEDEPQRENSEHPGNDVVYEQVGLLEGETRFTDQFKIFDQGTYQVSLTDFNFPKPLTMAGLNITTATGSLGSLLDTGSFTFDADPGSYYVSFFAEADRLGQYGIKIAQYNTLISGVGTSTVPVPSAVWLFGSGLFGLIGAIRKKKA